MLLLFPLVRLVHKLVAVLLLVLLDPMEALGVVLLQSAVAACMCRWIYGSTDKWGKGLSQEGAQLGRSKGQEVDGQ